MEEILGRLKTVAMLGRARCRGLVRPEWMFGVAAADYNLFPVRNLAPESAPVNDRGELCLSSPEGAATHRNTGR